MVDRTLAVILLFQALAGMAVLRRLVRSRKSEPLSSSSPVEPTRDSVTVILPVRNEAERIASCLESICAMSGVTSVLVVDGGSTDATWDLASEIAGQIPTVRVLQAGASPREWNGKVWGLQHGLDAVCQETDWILTLDADVTVGPMLLQSLMERAKSNKLDLVSVATEQRVDGRTLSMLHPSMLTTLVYRFGIPGQVASSVPINAVVSL